MASYSEVVNDDYGRPVPGVSVYVFNRDGSLATLLNGGTNPLTTDTYGRYSFDAADAVYAIEYRFAGTTKRLDSVLVGDPPEYVGLTGPADNTYSSYGAMQASDPTRKSARLVGDTDSPPHPDGPYNNPTQTINGWVPQTADGVVFKQPGGTPRTLQDKAADVVSAKDFGAKGDFAHDDTAGLQAAISNLGLLGGEVEFNAGSRFLITSANPNACLSITSPIALTGKAGLFSAITPSSSAATTAAAINFIPTTVPGDFSRFENIYLGNPFNGTRGGGVGLRISTSNTGITAGRILVGGCFTAAGNGTGFVHENDDAANLTGGLFCSEFRRNVWVNGMRFGDATHGTGDSLLFTTNTTTGPGFGVEFTGTIDAAGNTPSQTLFLNHNSTSQSGAFLFHRANFPTIQNANIEQTSSNPGGTLVNFSGDRKPNNSTGVRAPSLTNSLVSAFGGVNLDALARFGSVTGGICFNNWFLDGGGGATYDIVVSSGARDVWIGPNLSVSDDLRILNNGVGTRGGNNTPLMLESGWVAPGNGEASAYTYKTIDGEISVSGGAKNGTTSPGAPVMIMPEGFRPLEIELRHCLCLDNGSWATPAVVSFNPNGEVKIIVCPNAAGNTQKIYFNATFRSAHPCTIKVPTPYVV